MSECSYILGGHKIREFPAVCAAKRYEVVVKMAKSLYQIWINDDDEYKLNNAVEYLHNRFPGVLHIREHTSLDDVTGTLIRGGYMEWHTRHKIDPDISPPDLVIQDYVFSPAVDVGKKNCLRTLKYMVEYFPSAQVVISTTQENFQGVKSMLRENGMDFPVTGKIDRYDGNPVIENIIVRELQNRGYKLTANTQ